MPPPQCKKTRTSRERNYLSKSAAPRSSVLEESKKLRPLNAVRSQYLQRPILNYEL